MVHKLVNLDQVTVKCILSCVKDIRTALPEVCINPTVTLQFFVVKVKEALTFLNLVFSSVSDVSSQCVYQTFSM